MITSSDYNRAEVHITSPFPDDDRHHRLDILTTRPHLSFTIIPERHFLENQYGIEIMATSTLFEVPIGNSGKVAVTEPAAKVYLLTFTSPPDNRLTTVSLISMPFRKYF